MIAIYRVVVEVSVTSRFNCSWGQRKEIDEKIAYHIGEHLDNLVPFPYSDVRELIIKFIALNLDSLMEASSTLLELAYNTH